MTLTARILVGDKLATAAPFPEPGFDLAPGTLGLAAQYLLNEDHSVNMGMVYPNIGFDALSARRQLAALAEEKKRSGKEPDTEHRITVKQFRIAAKAVGLELIAGLFLSCLDTPVRVRSPCRVFFEGGRAFPYYAAPCGNPDARADYDGFVLLAEVTTMRRFGSRKEIEERWASARAHAEEAASGRRLFCLMVSRLGLDDKRNWMASALAEAQEAQEARREQARLKGAPTPSEVKYLVFDIEDIAAIAHKLDELYCQGRRKIQALTGDVLEALLDRLHARTMARLASGEGFHGGWAGAAFVEMLVDYAVRKKPIGDLLEAG